MTRTNHGSPIPSAVTPLGEREEPTELEALALGLSMGMAMPSRAELLALVRRANRQFRTARLATAEADRVEPDTFMDVLLEVSPLIQRCTEANGTWLGAHDAAKRLYRMGYRKVTAIELATCSKCGKEDVVTSQSICLDCAAPRTTEADAATLREAEVREFAAHLETYGTVIQREKLHGIVEQWLNARAALSATEGNDA